MKRLWSCFLLLCVLLAGCAQGSNIEEQKSVQEIKPTGFKTINPGEYDSADTAVVLKVKESDKTITFRNVKTAKNYTLTYDGTTIFSDKRGGAMTALQFIPGDIVDVTFIKSHKKCVSVTMNADAFLYTGVDNFKLDESGKGLSLGKDQYRYIEQVILLSDGEQTEILELNERDIVTLRGIDRTIYSITIEKGHGYLKLENEEALIGGWIEVGQKVIQKITNDMLLTVPVGKHQVQISHKGGSAVKEIEVQRNEEVKLDVGDIKVEETKIGNILFTIKPDEAEIYIDGDKADKSSVISLEYGIHQLIAKAEGYDTLNQYFKVGQENANLTIEMEKTKEESEEQKSEEVQEENSQVSSNDSGVSSNTAEEAREVGTYKVTIEAPSEVEVYVDGKYMGVTPVSFAKEAGIHVVILRKSGYRTRSYTIQVDQEKKDVSWSFAELVKSKTDSGE